MKFGEISVKDAAGAILAHRIRTETSVFQKGRYLSSMDIEVLKDDNVENIWVARLEPGDIEENDAATLIAEAVKGYCVICGEASTGRVNFYAADDGIFLTDASHVNAINLIDPAITIATLRPFERVCRNQIIATIKIIPYAVSDMVVRKACELAADSQLLTVKPFSGLSVNLIQCVDASIKQSVLEKPRAALEDRISIYHGNLASEIRAPHSIQPLADVLGQISGKSDLIVVFGASAIADQSDVVPSGIVRAGGKVVHVGMPVDPGNLLVLRELAGKPVIGAPGCARGPKFSGFDLVLSRLMAGIDVEGDDIALMGVGGLLTDVPRPHPRRSEASATVVPTMAIAVLAAGKSSRMGQYNKMLARLDGVPLVRLSVEMALSADRGKVIVVTGFMAERVAACVEDLPAQKVFNPAFATGLASSLKCAIRALPPACRGVLIHLADMPGITASHVRQLCDVFEANNQNCIVRATSSGKRGNPVILPRSLFDEIFTLEGDVGARAIIERSGLPIHEVELGSAAELDIDTVAALNEIGGEIVFSEPI